MLILEDDATFSAESIGRFKDLLPYLWTNRDKWERFNGGPTVPKDPIVEVLDREHRLVYVNGFCTHFDLIHSGAYDTVLQWDPENDKQIDVYFMGLQNGPSGQFRSIATAPHISVQASSASDIAPGRDASPSDYSAMFRWSEAKIMDCLNLLHTDKQQTKKAGAAVAPTIMDECETTMAVRDYVTEVPRSFSSEKAQLETALLNLPNDHSLLATYFDLLSEMSRENFGVIYCTMPNVRTPVAFRAHTSDLSNMRQIFLNHEYGFDIAPAPRRILDLGAYCGYAALYLANKYQNATIMCVEPSKPNFAMLRMNTVHYHNIRCIHGAVWNRATALALKTHHGGHGQCVRRRRSQFE